MSKYIGAHLNLGSQLLAALLLADSMSIPKANATIIVNYRVAQLVAPIGYYYPGRFYDGPRWYPLWPYRYNHYNPAPPYWRPWYR